MAKAALWRLLTACCAALLLLSGCTSWQQRDDLTEYDWQVEGKLAIRTVNTNGETRNERASFRWRQYQQQFLFEVFSPIGTRLYMIQGRPGAVFYSDYQDQHMQAASLQQLMAQQLGYQLPLDDFASWLFDPAALAAAQPSLAAADWHVARSNYNEQRLQRLLLRQSNGSQLMLVITAYVIH